MEGVIKTSFSELLESACVRPHLPANLSNLFRFDAIWCKIQLKNSKTQIGSSKLEQAFCLTILASASDKRVAEGATRHELQALRLTIEWRHRRWEARIQLDALSPVASNGLFALVFRMGLATT